MLLQSITKSIMTQNVDVNYLEGFCNIKGFVGRFDFELLKINIYCCFVFMGNLSFSCSSSFVVQ